MICKGIGGSLELLDDRLIIHRPLVSSFLWGYGIKGDKTIPYSHIVVVQVKRAGPVLSGYIQFTIAGGIREPKGNVGQR